jgi:hypothetical protein
MTEKKGSNLLEFHDIVIRSEESGEERLGERDCVTHL